MKLRTLAACVSLAMLVAPALAAPEPAGGNSSMDKEGRVRVQIFPQQQTVLGAEVNAKISRLSLKEGDRFNAGQVLFAFDCAMHQAQLSKAQAQLEAARQTLKVNKRLEELNSIGRLEVDQAEAKTREAEAEVAAMRVVVGKCTVTAPFAGRVAKVHADAHQYVQQGKPVLEIVDTRNPELRLLVPSSWLAWLAKGSRLTVRVDELQRDYAARVARIGARIDPVSQTVSVTAEIDGAGADLLPGMSGWATFQGRK